MSTTSDRMRAWDGPALFTFGFRPFFLGAAIWAAFAMAVWIAMLSGFAILPIGMDPVSWHAHAFLFGYLGAVMAGFMMTAVPNWTGRMPLVGWPLAALWVLWLCGRFAVALSAWLPPAWVMGVDLAFPLVLAGAMSREIIAGKNWRNLSIVGLLMVFICANFLFHIEIAQGDFAAHGIGVRLGLSAAIVMIALIGGRIVPSFTRNWLAKRGATKLPVPPMQGYDKLAILGLVLALGLWVWLPEGRLSAVALILAGLLHMVRLGRWRGLDTGAEPLVWVLHAGYACVPLGAVLIGFSGIFPGALALAAAQHIWMAGAIGVMTLAVMTRASLGHTGQALQAGPGSAALYLLLILSVVARLAAGMFVATAGPLYTISALLWIGAFAGFAILYGPCLLTARK